MATRIHLKTWPEDFEAVRAGTKTHEARRADRPFAVGVILVLEEWIPEDPELCHYRDSGQTGRYTGKILEREVTHLTMGEYGLPPDLAIMSIRPTDSSYGPESERV